MWKYDTKYAKYVTNHIPHLSFARPRAKS